MFGRAAPPSSVSPVSNTSFSMPLSDLTVRKWRICIAGVLLHMISLAVFSGLGMY